MKYRGIFEYEYPTEHKTPVSIDVHLHGDCVKGKIIEWEYRPLEQEPCEDAVSRAEAKKIAKEMYLEVANMELNAKTISDCISCASSKCREVLERKLQALPSVIPQEPRKGHWCPQNDDCFDWYEYSECGYGSEGEMQYSSEYDVRTNFCPNCGADMRKDEE